jgi:hypothetical protein
MEAESANGKTEDRSEESECSGIERHSLKGWIQLF